MPASHPAPVVCDTEAAVGALAAELLRNRLAARPLVRLLLPTGHTPRDMYAQLRSGPGGFAGATVLQLDEYAGLGPSDPRSFAAELRRELAGVALAELHTIDGGADDLAAEAQRHAQRLTAAPIDVAVLGLGRNGHVAFDEPGSPLAAGVHLVALAEQTRDDAAPAFTPARPPERGLTTGLGTLLACRELVLLVTGEQKAEILRRVLRDPPAPDRPASLLRAHPRLTIVCDRAAAGALDELSDHAVVVLGHREPGVSEEHRISRESLERLQRAERLVQRQPARAVVLTGYTTTGGLSEAEQMAAAWRDPGVPVLLDVAGRDTAENATRSLPLLEALGGVRRVTVVTSFWHVRAGYFFRPYRRCGMDVAVRREWRGRGWPRLLASELAKVARARRDRRAAWATPASGGDLPRV